MNKRLIALAYAIIAVFAIACIALLSACSSNAIDERAFPDEALREAILESVDADHDGSLTREEEAAVESLDLSSTAVSSLAGLGRFTNLRELDVSHCEGLATPDFGETPGLITLDVSDSAVEAVDADKMPDLESLEAQGSRILELDVSSNAKLEYVGVDRDVSVVGADASRLEERVCLVSCQSRELQKLENAMSSSITGIDTESYDFDYDCGRAELHVTHDQKGAELSRSSTDAYAWDEAGVVTGSSKHEESGDSTGVQYRYDSAGRLLACESTVQAYTSAYDYDVEGRLVAAKAYLQENGGFSNEVRYSYDNQGRLAATVMEDLRDGAVFSEATVSYDDRGLVSAMEDRRKAYSFEYDGEGRCIAQSLRSIEFQYSEDTAFDYDVEGRIVRARRVHQERGASFTLDVICEFDEDGRETRRDYTLDGEAGELGTASVEFTYARLFLQPDFAESLLDSRRCLLCYDSTRIVRPCSPLKADVLSGQSPLVRAALYYMGPLSFAALSA